MFNNTFILDDLFNRINGNEIAVIIMDPKEGFETLLLRIAANNGNRKRIGRFLEKNLLLEHIEEARIKRNGIIEIILKPSEDFNYLRYDFLKHLSRLSED